MHEEPDRLVQLLDAIDSCVIIHGPNDLRQLGAIGSAKLDALRAPLAQLNARLALEIRVVELLAGYHPIRNLE